MADNTWSDLEEVVAVPAGDKTFSISCRSQEENSIELNWFQFLPTTVGIGLDEISTIFLYPNPCKDLLHVHSLAPIYGVEIFDSSGRKFFLPFTVLNVLSISQRLLIGI